MTIWHPEPPQGETSEQGLVIIGRPVIPRFGAPQGIGESIQVDDPILALFPPIGDVTFQFYKFYEINKNQVPTTQTNMPILIIDTLGPGIIQEGSGFDIRAFDSAGVPIPYEVESVNPSTGDIIVWINMATVKDLEFIQLTFGKPTAIDASNPNAVYDSNYKSVYHLNGVGNDSTSNIQDMVMNNTPPVSAKIGTGLDFLGDVTSFTIMNPYTVFPSTEITVEFWIKTPVTSVGDGFVSYATGGPPDDNHFLVFNESNINVYIVNSLRAIGFAINDNTFHLLTVTWRSSDGRLLVYDNGVAIFSDIHQQGESFTNNGALVLGQEQDSVGGGFTASQALLGILEEVRISDMVRSGDYITTTFNNQNDNDAFWFKTSLLESSVPALLADDMGRVIVVGQP